MPFAPGVTDRSGEIRAQGMLQGGMGLLGGLEQGVDLWKKNKDEEKKLQASIKSAEALIQSISPIATQINPEFDKIIKDLSLKVSDPKLSTLERATLSQNALKGIGELMGSGLELKKMQAEQARQQEIAKAQIAADNAKVQQMQRAQAIQQLVGIGRANQGNIPVQLLEKVDPGMYAEAQNILDKVRKDNTRTYETVDENGYVTTVTEDPFMGRIGSAPKLPAGMKMPARGQAQGSANDPFTTVQQAVQPEVIAGGELDLRQRELARVQADSRAKAERQQSDTRASVTATLQNADEALQLAGAGAGGRWNSLFSGVGAFLGSQENLKPGNMGSTARLEDLIDSIKASLTLEKLTELRRNSPTGGALGNVSDRDLAVLANSVRTLNSKMPREKIMQDINAVADQIARIGGVEREKAAVDKSSVRDKTGKGRFKIVEVK